MNKVDYCHKRLMRNLVLCAGGGPLAIYFLPGAIGWVAGAFCLAGAALFGAKAFGDPSAVLWDQRGLTFISLTGRNSVEWREVERIDVQRMTQYMLGIVPVNRWDFLIVKTRGGFLASKKYRINATLLDLPGGSSGLADTLARAQQAALTGAAIPAAPVTAALSAVPREPAAAERSEFDPDAAIARYLARKAAEGGSAAEAAPAAPVRPVFGRKAV